MSEIEQRKRIVKIQNDMNDMVKTLHLHLNSNDLDEDLLSKTEECISELKNFFENKTIDVITSVSDKNLKVKDFNVSIQTFRYFDGRYFSKIKIEGDDIYAFTSDKDWSSYDQEKMETELTRVLKFWDIDINKHRSIFDSDGDY